MRATAFLPQLTRRSTPVRAEPVEGRSKTLPKALLDWLRAIGVTFLTAGLTMLTLLAQSLPARADSRPAGDHILIVTSDSGGAYAQSEAALRVELAGAAMQLRTLPPSEFTTDGARHDTRLVIALGAQAAEAVASAQPDVAVIATLLAHETFRQIWPQAVAGRHAAVFLDQPPGRQIDALVAALPRWQRIALIASPASTPAAEALAEAADSRGLTAEVVRIRDEREMFGAMQRALAEPAVLIALPDRLLYNAHTIQNILLTTYRQRSPVLGISPAYVRAGALLAVHTTPEQIARQVARLARRTLNGEPLPEAEPPDDFEIAVNTTVARSLGIHLDPPEVIRQRMLAAERGR